jgi:hypothetical protein
VISLFPPFLKFGNLNFPFCSSRLNVHVPLFDGPESFMFKFYGNVTNLPVDKLIRRYAERCFVGRSICPHSFAELALPTPAHLIHCLLKDIIDLLVRCFCLTTYLRVIWSGNLVIVGAHKTLISCANILSECMK